MCVANDAALADRLDIFRVHGSRPKYYHAFVGGNFRLDEIQAAVLNIKFPHLDSWTKGRQENACFYFGAFEKAGLLPKVTLPGSKTGARHIYNQFIIRVQDRDALRTYLQENGIGTEIYYPVPLHLQECFAYLGHKAGDFPESERAATHTLAIPIYPELQQDQLQYVVDTIAAFYASRH
jgi:dTDP-4-amino-4,6-dideoxygalactose transaminase